MVIALSLGGVRDYGRLALAGKYQPEERKLNDAARSVAFDKQSFDAFLTSLDENPRRAGEKYEQIRTKLINFFAWRGALSPEDDADETINRVIRKLAQGDQIRDPGTFVYGIARMVALETVRKRDRQAPLEDAMTIAIPEPEDDAVQSELRLSCLDRCLIKLPETAREMITEYYRKEKSDKIEHRKHLAERFGIPVNALRIRALRTREKLSVCIEGCVKELM